jgi:hypothetical protein
MPQSPTRVPARKVSASAAAGILASLFISIGNRAWGWGITADEAGYIVTLAVFAAGYFTPPHKRDLK